MGWHKRQQTKSDDPENPATLADMIHEGLSIFCWCNRFEGVLRGHGPRQRAEEKVGRGSGLPGGGAVAGVRARQSFKEEDAR